MQMQFLGILNYMKNDVDWYKETCKYWLIDFCYNLQYVERAK